MADDEWAIGLVHTGRIWDQSRALGEQALIGEHMTYLARLIEAGEVAQAGPVIAPDQGPSDDGFIALIIYTVDARRARQLADGDPAVRSGLVTLDIRPWYAAA